MTVRHRYRTENTNRWTVAWSGGSGGGQRTQIGYVTLAAGVARYTPTAFGVHCSCKLYKVFILNEGAVNLLVLLV